MLPHDLPPWQPPFITSALGAGDGTWQRAHDTLRSLTRQFEGRQASPSAAIRQPIGCRKGGSRGTMRARMKGRKRHISIPWGCCWSGGASGQHTRPGRRQAGVGGLLGQYPRLKVIWADGAYGGKLVQWAKEAGGWNLEPRQQHTFQVLPRRWVVERTFGWLNLQRRLSKDYEGLCETTAADLHRHDRNGFMLRTPGPGPQLIRHPLRAPS